jgi:hypothetical protein
MFGIIIALTFYILPWVIIPAMAVLIWLLRRRLLRALLALAALVLVAVTHSREFLYSIGLGLPHPDDEPGPLISALSALESAVEWYAWQNLALAAVSAAVLSWPLPDGRGKRVLAVMVVVWLGVSAALVWLFSEVRFI